MKKAIGTIFILFAFLTVYSQEQVVSNNSAETKIRNAGSLEIENQLEVYPNPSIDYIIVNINKSTLKDVSFDMHSVIGNTIHVEFERLGDSKFKIDTKHYSPGYYFLVVKDEYTQFKQAFKFLKK